MSAIRICDPNVGNYGGLYSKRIEQCYIGFMQTHVADFVVRVPYLPGTPVLCLGCWVAEHPTRRMLRADVFFNCFILIVLL